MSLDTPSAALSRERERGGKKEEKKRKGKKEGGEREEGEERVRKKREGITQDFERSFPYFENIISHMDLVRRNFD